MSEFEKFKQRIAAMNELAQSLSPDDAAGLAALRTALEESHEALTAPLALAFGDASYLRDANADELGRLIRKTHETAASLVRGEYGPVEYLAVRRGEDGTFETQMIYVFYRHVRSMRRKLGKLREEGWRIVPASWQMTPEQVTDEVWERLDPSAKPRSVKALAQNIPIEMAWKEGRYVYVRADVGSRLDAELRAIGGVLCGERRALRIGGRRGKEVPALILEHLERLNALAAVKALDLWVAIPHSASLLRERAEQLGGRHDSTRKQWAMPSKDALVEIRNAVDAWQEKQEVEREAAKAAARQERRKSAAGDDSERATSLGADDEAMPLR